MSNKQSKQELSQVDWEKWTPETIKLALIHNNKVQAMSEELKQVFREMPREMAIHLDPRLFAKWRLMHRDYDTEEAIAKRRKRASELKDWSSKVRQILNNPDLTTLMLKQDKLPTYLNVLEGQTPADVMVAALVAKGMMGDIRAVDMLRKLGWGDKVTIDAGESFFNKEAIQIEIVDPKPETKRLEKEEFGNIEKPIAVPPKPEMEKQPEPPIAADPKKEIDPSLIRNMVITKDKRK